VSRPTEHTQYDTHTAPSQSLLVLAFPDKKHFARSMDLVMNGQQTNGVHTMSLGMYKGVQEEIESWIHTIQPAFVLVTGHGIGCTLAWLCIQQLTIPSQAYLIGAPRPGMPLPQQQQEQNTKNIFTILNDADMLTTLPWSVTPNTLPPPPASGKGKSTSSAAEPWLYQHTGRMIRGIKTYPSITKNHDLNTYFNLFEKT
jgi:hypothetical protein